MWQGYVGAGSLLPASPPRPLNPRAQQGCLPGTSVMVRNTWEGRGEEKKSGRGDARGGQPREEGQGWSAGRHLDPQGVGVG